jgi:hypothetical protein
MKKRQLFLIVVLGLSFGVSNYAASADIFGCYQKNNGQLRIVQSHNECRPSELPITLGGPATGIKTSLLCVTGLLSFPPRHNSAYCQDKPATVITNPFFTTDIKFEDVFEVICLTPPYPLPFTSWEDPVMWGLRCKSGWANTGCSASTYTQASADVPQFLNGCHSDDEEYGNADIFTTCCKIINE